MEAGKIKIVSSLLLLLTAFVWGIAFVAQSVGTDYVGPWTFVCTRYILSTIVLIPVTLTVEKRISAGGRNNPADIDFSTTVDVGLSANYYKQSVGGQSYEGSVDAGSSSLKKRPKTAFRNSHLFGGMCCGIFLGFASITQQAGIEYTTAGKAGFITALYVIFVPIFGLFLKKKPSKIIWLSAVLGLLGLYLISIKEGFTLEKGDALVVLCAILFSFQILSIDHFTGKLKNPIKLANIQFLFAAIIGLVGMLLFEQPRFSDIAAAAVPIIYAGVFSGAVGYTLQIVAQKNIDPAVASLLMCLESVFAALAGWIILGEVMTAREFAGCAVLLLAVVLAELPWERIKHGRQVR